MPGPRYARWEDVLLHRLLACLFIASAAFLAACGGGEEEPLNSTEEAIAACLNPEAAEREYEVTIGPSLMESAGDFLKRPENALFVDFQSGNAAFVVAEENAADADATERDFEEPSAGTAEVIRQGNVVVGWTKEPTEAERAALDRCV